MSDSTAIADIARTFANGSFVPILLQKSEIEVRRIFRENKKHEAIADSYTLARPTEVAGEFYEGR
jgi:hypothetical protein